MALKTKYSRPTTENNGSDNLSLLITSNLGTFLIGYLKNRTDSKKFQQEKAKLKQLINDAQQAQQQAENERDTARRELDTALNAQKAAEKEINEQKPKLIQKENELNGANQKINEYRAQLANKEQQITHQINQSLDLGLNNPSLEQVIERIQELINKPPLTFYQEFSDSELEEQLKSSQQTISKLEKQLKEQTPFGEDLNAIKELELQSLEELFGKGNNL
jgi:chromosome segregation ATPase